MFKYVMHFISYVMQFIHYMHIYKSMWVHICKYHILFIHPANYGLLDCSHILTVVSGAVMNSRARLSCDTLGIYSVVLVGRLLDNMAALLPVFKEIFMLLFIIAALTYITSR